MPAGRPPLYSDPEVLQERIDEYFAQEDLKITIYGLILYCGFCDRQSFYAYEKKPEFSHTIKKARSKIAGYYESKLLGNTTAGAIFALKNFGWSDKQDINIKGDVKVKTITGVSIIRDTDESETETSG